MKKDNYVGYPTLGELLKFTYDAFGILPRKYSHDDGIDEKAKKTIQTKLSRLASEKGLLEQNFAELTKQLSSALSSHLPYEKLIFPVGEILFDLFDVYNQTVKSEATYLNKKETLKWFISNFVVRCLVFSVNKQLLRFNIASEMLNLPNMRELLLPTLNGNEIEYPLAKTLHWIYKSLDISPRDFHIPDKDNSDTIERQEQNYESACNWIKGKNYPTLNVLVDNINYSLSAITNSSHANIKKVISNEQRKSIHVALILARLSTHIFREIHQTYGPEYLAKICEQYLRYSDYLLSETSGAIVEIHDRIKFKTHIQSEIDDLYFELIPKYFTRLNQKQHLAGREVNPKICMDPTNSYAGSKEVERLVKRHGEFFIVPLIDCLKYRHNIEIPDSFAHTLVEGLGLKDSAETTLEHIEQFEIRLTTENCDALLPWLSEWIRGNFYYRNLNYKDAFPHIKNAFYSAQYCAGSYQNILVKQFIELAAKSNNWKEFKKAVEWAEFINIPIINSNNRNHSESNLRELFQYIGSNNPPFNN